MEAPLIHIEEFSSTNAWMEVQMRKQNLAEGTMVMADFQSSGRGQAENSWESEPGKNLLCSILLKPDFLHPSLQFHLSRVIALGCFDALADYTDKLSLKWPNDIYFENKKLGGILIENSLMGNVFGSCISGIGINLNQMRFISDAPNPVSLKQIINKNINQEEVALKIQSNILKWYNILKQGHTASLEDAYAVNLYRKQGKWPFSIDSRHFLASIESVESAGRIVLKTDKGIEKYWFKEVEFAIE